MSGSNGVREKCSAETNDGSPCEHTRNPCPVHGPWEKSPDTSPDETDGVVPTDEEWYDSNADTLALAMGMSDSWDGATMEETVARSLIRKAADDTDEKKALYRDTFGPCEVCGDRGTNGWSEATCADCDAPDGTTGGDGDGDVSLDDLSDDAKNQLIDDLRDRL